jgi:hypothetical protein
LLFAAISLALGVSFRNTATGVIWNLHDSTALTLATGSGQLGISLADGSFPLRRAIEAGGKPSRVVHPYNTTFGKLLKPELMPPAVKPLP